LEPVVSEKTVEQRIAEAWLAGIRHVLACPGCPLCLVAPLEPEQTLAESVQP
jgi:hypothetical protein